MAIAVRGLGLFTTPIFERMTDALYLNVCYALIIHKLWICFLGSMVVQKYLCTFSTCHHFYSYRVIVKSAP